MSNNVFKFNKESGKTIFTPLANVKTVQSLSDDDRARLSEIYGRDMSAFQTSISFFGRDKDELSTNSLEDFEQEGIPFVNIGDGQMFPAANFHGAESFVKKDKEELEKNKNTTLTKTFRSRVHTKSGQVVCCVRHPSQITASVDKALNEANQKPAVKSEQNLPEINHG